jgi:glycerol-3-phosphate acyltransferase PlsX
MTPVLALDAMGGDHAPRAVFEGALQVLESGSGVRFAFFATPEAASLLEKDYPALRAASTCHCTDDVVLASDKPASALRQRRQSTMAQAIRAVAQGEAQAVVSSGNTGAFMAMSLLTLRPLPGIDRPAIVKAMPTLKGFTVVLDLGANATCTAQNLFQFAIMGGVYARVVLGCTRPAVGLLNIGSEENKGHAVIQEAFQLCQDHLPGFLRLHGFVEGDDITSGTVDVVVTDGFTGNVALKTAEGTVRLIVSGLREALTGSLRGKMGALMARPALNRFKASMDPRRYNGAIFLGLNGVAVKSHGGSDGFGFSWAIRSALDLVQGQVLDQTREALTHLPPLR